MEHVTRAVVREAGSSKLYNAVEIEGHSFVMDEPAFMGGTDLGPAPFGLVASALGACTNMTLRMYAGMKKLPLDEVNTEIANKSPVHKLLVSGASVSSELSGEAA
jgi:uncharacterized OsmC-like protein